MQFCLSTVRKGNALGFSFCFVDDSLLFTVVVKLQHIVIASLAMKLLSKLPAEVQSVSPSKVALKRCVINFYYISNFLSALHAKV